MLRLRRPVRKKNLRGIRGGSRAGIRTHRIEPTVRTPCAVQLEEVQESVATREADDGLGVRPDRPLAQPPDHHPRLRILDSSSGQQTPPLGPASARLNWLA